MVVPVLVAFGRGRPLSRRKVFLERERDEGYK
jgi:hypothetical protein